MNNTVSLSPAAQAALAALSGKNPPSQRLTPEDSAKLLLSPVISQTQISQAVAVTLPVLETVKEKQVWLLKQRSYSSNLVLHRCPKKLQLDTLAAMSGEGEEEEDNVDFAFGHSLAAGVQTLFLPEATKEDAQLAAFMAWDIPLEEEKPKKKKSFWYVLRAIDLAVHLVAEIQSEGWVIADFNGTPGIEYSVKIHLPDGFKYIAHIDLILYHPVYKKYRIIEIKTSGFSVIHEAMYANSSQALSYSIALDYLVKHQTTYDVLYIAYSCPEMEFTMLPFSKSNLVKVEWIRDILHDCETIKGFIKTNYFPKRGEACYDFFKPCPYFGGCGYADSYLGIDRPEILDLLIEKEIKNQKIDKHNKRGYDIEIQLVDLIQDKLLMLDAAQRGGGK